MAKTSNINIRIDPDIKEQAEHLFSKFGITITDAINMFLHQSINVGGIPFAPHIPNVRPFGDYLPYGTMTRCSVLLDLILLSLPLCV